MRQARRSVALALIGAAAVGVALLTERMWSAQALSEASERHATAVRLAGEIRVTEQQLLLAADAASRTGEAGWVDRFDRLANQQTQTTEHTLLLAPAAIAEQYRVTTRETASLVQRMRSSALMAMTTGSHEAARGLFESDAYRKAGTALNHANEQLAQAMQASTAAELTQLKQRSYWVTAATLMLALALGLALWRRLSNGLDASRSSLLHAEGRIQRLACSDLLTGMDNRAGLHDAMQLRMHLARSNQEQLAVLMVDLDRFKPINDRNGHMVGDLVLKEVATRLSQCLRQSDLRARYGGDEFVVVVDEREGPGSAQGSAERIVDRLSEPMRFGELTVSIGASVGVARFPADGETDDELLRKADWALYRAKKGGRGSVCIYDPKQDEVMSEQHKLEQELREGIANGELVPFYQPIVGLARRNVLSLELLCRWRHPVRGLLTPDKFIPLAEHSGLIAPLTISLLRAACKDLSRFPPHWRLSFNVAPQQIQDETLVYQLMSVLQEAGVPPTRLDVELTETALVNDTARARQVILALKKTGMTVTLDDFGTGYSSLSYLAEMTFDKIKIDRSFVHTMQDRPQSAKIIDAIIGLSRSLGVSNVAEGVETELQASMLLKMGCQTGQGYLFGRPVPAKELNDRIALANNTMAPVKEEQRAT